MTSPLEKIVYVVDDDLRIQEALQELFASMGIATQAFSSAGEFLAADILDVPSCLILDIELPDVNGLELQKQIIERRFPPIVFITGHGDIPSTVSAIRHGAIDYLTKPFREDDLIAAVETAITLDRNNRRRQAEITDLEARLNRLTPREREVLPLVVSGLLNKQAAAELGISEVTFQIHRGNVMRKMAAKSLADLVRIAEKVGITVRNESGARDI